MIFILCLMFSVHILSISNLLSKHNIFYNLGSAELIEKAVKSQQGTLSADGALVVRTNRTGRSPEDKFIVKEPSSEKHIFWGKINKPISQETYEHLRFKILEYLDNQPEVFVQKLQCGADPENGIPVNVITESSWHAAFANNMFIKKFQPTGQEPFWVLHAPNLKADPIIYKVNSQAFIVTNFAERTILIAGTSYAGEIKKAIFGAMNYFLPHKGILPMHASTNVFGDNCAIFFGLSGTGKTTLSADPDRHLIGDDEHGWTDKGVFNFEGGCYAKLVNLSKKYEPQIWHASNRFGSILENVVMDDVKRSPDFYNITITENTRGSYPIEFIANAKEDGMGPHPKNVIFLTCDAFGVLPPLSRLTLNQAAYHFISGYTAKVAGTEVGIVEPQATFSACFGAPFMPMHPVVYANMLIEKMKKHNVKCWLLNTGWIGGPYGVGSRIGIPFTRSMLRAILTDQLDDVDYSINKQFGLEVPLSCPDVPNKILAPKELWFESDAYDQQAKLLASMFCKNFEQYESACSEEVKQAGPCLKRCQA